MRHPQNPILITGIHRSGTSWLGKMLALGGEVNLINEPFNCDSWFYSLNRLVDKWYLYIKNGLEIESEAKFADQQLLNGHVKEVYSKKRLKYWVPFSRTGRPLIKDPIAAFSSEWLSHHFKMEAVKLLNHPAAFSASLKQMSWLFPFEDLLCQNSIMEEHLSSFRESTMSIKKSDIIQNAILIWNCVYSVLTTYLERNVKWASVKHEDLSKIPTDELEKLYNKLNLPRENHVETKIFKFTFTNNSTSAPEGKAHNLKRNSSNLIKSWKNILSENEVEWIYQWTYNIWSNFYSDDEW